MPSEKKVALISGANRGLGFETARQLGQQGVVVVVGARTDKAAKETADKLKAENIEAYPVTLEVTRDSDRKAAAKFVDGKIRQARHTGQQRRRIQRRWDVPASYD